ncbi:MAG: hypothetical protein M3342_21040 [Bacteroidota bacterium]|nr:hypothetical protein [Bacteroidota bacterium]
MKELPNDINSQTVKHFRKLLSEHRKNLVNDKETLSELFTLKDFLVKLEDDIMEKKSTTAAKELSQMTEEERRMFSNTR